MRALLSTLLLALLAVNTVHAQLVAKYEFTIDAADTAAFPAGPYNGTLLNGAAISNATLTLDGIDDYVELPPLSLNSNTITICCRLKRLGTQNEFTGIVLSRDGNTQAGIHFGGDIWDQPGDPNELRYSWNDQNYRFESNLKLPDDQWTFVALVLEPDKATLYQAANGLIESAINNTSHAIEEFDGVTWIGRDTHQDRFFTGSVDDVRIYNNALDERQIRALAGIFKAFAPQPAQGQPTDPTAAVLTWKLPSPRISGQTVTCDVWLDTDQNMTSALKIVDNQSVETTTNFTLVEDHIYYWRVDCHDPNGGSEVFTEGDIWNFNTINQPPIVDAGNNQHITLPQTTTQLDCIITDDGLPLVPGTLSATWMQTFGPEQAILGTSQITADHVTCDATFTTTGEYIFQLTAHDGELQTTDQITVFVHADANELDWAMPGANTHRTSWVPEEVRGSLSPVWYRPVEPYIGQNVQLITAEDKIFVSTARGLYAFDALNGDQLWIYPTEMPLGHSPTFEQGTLYVAGFDRKLHAVDSQTGHRIWTFDDANAGYSTNPLVVEGLVMLGNRDGWFYAINAVPESGQGQLAWKYKTDSPILYSAAYRAGIVYFCSQDMHCYALNAVDGSLVWKSEKLQGQGFNSWWPVIYRDKVVLTTVANYKTGSPGATSAAVYHDTGYGEIDTELVNGIERDSIWPDGGNWIDPDGLGYEPGDWASGTRTLNAQKTIDYFEQFPWRRNRYFLDAQTGNDWGFDHDDDGLTDYAPILTVATKNGLPAVPMVSNYDDVIYMSNVFKFNTWICRGGISGWKIGTPYISYITEGAVDEPRICSGGGSVIYETICCDREARGIDLANTSTHWNYWSYNLNAKCPGYDIMWHGVGSQDGTNNRLWGYYGSLNGIYHNHTGNQNPLIPYKGHLYTHRSNAVICLGPEGGSNAKELAPITTPPPDSQVLLTKSQIKQTLIEQIQKWVDAGHLHPGYFNGGQFGGVLNEYFLNPAENILTLIRALPHLPTDLRNDVNDLIQYEYQNYDTKTYAATGWDTGQSRDWFIYPPEVQADLVNFPRSANTCRGTHDRDVAWHHSFPPMNFYALWKYAEQFGSAADIYNTVKTKIDNSPLNNPLANVNVDDYPYELNAYIAGYIGYLELEKLAAQPETVWVRNTLDNMLAYRAQNFTKDTPFPSPTGFYQDTTSHKNRVNISRNFMYLTLELAEYMHDNALPTVQEALDEYNYVAPYWFVSRYEGCLQESTIQNLNDYGALFAARAWIMQQPFEELIKYLDVPGFMRGDLFYINNLISLIEAPKAAPTIAPDAAGLYIDPVTVTITSADLGDTIFYTLDGSEPDQQSILYTDPFVINTNTTVKARVYSPGAEAGLVATADFEIDTTAENQPPTVDAGNYQEINFPDNTLNLDGSVTDNTLPFPPGTVTTNWSVIDAPPSATVIFEKPLQIDTAATFDTPGSYLLQLTADDGQFIAADTVYIYINPLPQPQPVDVVNPSFELDAAGNVDTSAVLGFTNVLGWTQIQSVDGGVEGPKAVSDPTDGYRHMYGKWDSGNADTIHQTLNKNILPNEQYTLIFSARNASGQMLIQAWIGYEDNGQFTELTHLQTPQMDGQIWDDYQLTFSSEDSENYISKKLALRFQIGPRNAQWGGWACIDNVRVEVLAPNIPGDFNGDGNVDITDLAQMADNWLWQGNPAGIITDIVKDGKIDLVDFSDFADIYGDN